MGEINIGLSPKKDFGLPPSTRCGHAQEGNIKKEGEILYIIILYRQNLRECKAYQTLLHDRKNVYIHDNSPIGKDYSPKGENVSPIASAPDDLPEGWVYVSDPSNPGLSAAYNAAARYARDHGFEWLVITDQDTAYAAGAGDRYENLPSEYPEEGVFMPRVSIPGGMYISPVKKRFYMARPQAVPEEGRVRLDKTAVINSGLMVSVDAFERSGGYNEKVFLDFSDYQFIDRLAEISPYGRVTKEETRQSFSANDDKGDARLNRFGLFCRSLAGYDKKRLATRLGIGMAAMKRTLSLAIGLRSMKPFEIFLKNYII